MPNNTDAETGRDGGERPTQEPAGDIQAVTRTARILSLFGPQCEQLSAAEVSESLKLNRTTAYRYLQSMVGSGLLSRQGSKFNLGQLMTQVAAFHWGQQEILKIAPGHMNALTRDVRLTSTLSMLGTSGPVVAHVSQDRSYELVLTVPIGTHLGPVSAHAQVWRAFGSVGQVTDLSAEEHRLPEETRAGLIRDISETQRVGIGMRATPQSGFVAIAAPVMSGSVLTAVLALVGTPALLPAARESPLAEALSRCALDISRALTP